MLVEQVQDLTDSAIGVAQGRRFVPLAVTIFIFLLVCNWMEVIPSGHNPEWLPPPTADVNLPLAMALTVIYIVHYNSFKARGFRGYFHHYLTPYPVLLPINIIEEITKPITLTFRLFGNIFASVLMVSVIVALLPDLPRARRRADLEAVRPLRRRDPGLHLRPADDHLPQHRHEHRRALDRTRDLTRPTDRTADAQRTRGGTPWQQMPVSTRRSASRAH